MTTFTLKIASNLPVPLPNLWQKVSTMEGVNHELAPFIHMTSPAAMRRLPFTQAPLKQPMFASWLLLFGILPFDRHQLGLDEVWEGGFRENSSSLIHRVWRHERMITANGADSTLTDTLEFEPRVPLLGFILLPIVRFVFQHRHRRLKQFFV
jgi:ligand-binding SRPBCC domain-containing protein